MITIKNIETLVEEISLSSDIKNGLVEIKKFYFQIENNNNFMQLKFDFFKSMSLIDFIDQKHFNIAGSFMRYFIFLESTHQNIPIEKAMLANFKNIFEKNKKSTDDLDMLWPDSFRYQTSFLEPITTNLQEDIIGYDVFSSI